MDGLSDLKIRQAQAQAKGYNLWDTGQTTGLYLRVESNGKKYWRLRYYINNKAKLKGLGSYPTVSLAKARELANQIRARVKAGEDVIEVDRQKEVDAKGRAEAEKAQNENTFEKLARQWFEHKYGEKINSAIKCEKKRLEKLINDIGNIPITELRAKDVLPHLQEIENTGHIQVAYRVAAIARQVCEHAMLLGLVDVNFLQSISRLLKPMPEVKHREALIDQVEVGKMLKAVWENNKSYPSIILGLKLIIYLPVRVNELRLAQWEEFDFDKKLWTIPCERMKNGKEHVVPLSKQVIELLEELKKYNGNSKFILASLNNPEKVIGQNAMLYCLKTSDLDGKYFKLTVHGLRGMFSSLLNELSSGQLSEVIEKQLSHTDKDKVRASYNQAQYIEQRRELMQKYADLLDELRLNAE